MTSKEPLRLTVEQVIEYLRCPTYYDTLYNKQLVGRKEKNLNERLSEVANYFCTQLMNGTVVEPYDLKKRWDREKGLTPQENLYGVDALTRMYKWAREQQLRVLNIASPFALSLPGEKEHVILIGKLGCIAYTKTGAIELLYFDFSKRLPDQALLDSNLRNTIDAFAFSRMYKEKLKGIRVRYVMKDKDYFTTRAKDDYERLARIVDNVGFSLRNKLFYPRESILCTGCDMKLFCRGWKPEKKKLNTALPERVIKRAH